jgi:hypothetical protein
MEQNTSAKFNIIFPLLVTTWIAIAGWLAVDYLNSARDRSNKLVELRMEYIMSIYRRIERSVGKEVTREIADDIETALADLQLLGDEEQVVMAQNYVAQWGNRKLDGISVNVILEGVRNSIRTDLGLEPITVPIEHLRLHLAPPSGNPSLPVQQQKIP